MRLAMKSSYLQREELPHSRMMLVMTVAATLTRAAVCNTTNQGVTRRTPRSLHAVRLLAPGFTDLIPVLGFACEEPIEVFFYRQV